MNLRHRLGRSNGGNAAPAPLLANRAPEAEPDRYQQIKKQLHRELIGKLDLAQLEGLDDGDRRAQVERVARRLIVDGSIVGWVGETGACSAALSVAKLDMFAPNIPDAAAAPASRIS